MKMADATTDTAMAVGGSNTDCVRGLKAKLGEDYLFPNDEDECDRLDMMHAMFTHMMHGELFLAPIGPNPGRVLDICTGTGIWAIDFGNTGVELSCPHHI